MKYLFIPILLIGLVIQSFGAGLTVSTTNGVSYNLTNHGNFTASNLIVGGNANFISSGTTNITLDAASGTVTMTTYSGTGNNLVKLHNKTSDPVFWTKSTFDYGSGGSLINLVCEGDNSTGNQYSFSYSFASVALYADCYTNAITIGEGGRWLGSYSEFHENTVNVGDAELSLNCESAIHHNDFQILSGSKLSGTSGDTVSYNSITLSKSELVLANNSTVTSNQIAGTKSYMLFNTYSDQVFSNSFQLNAGSRFTAAMNNLQNSTITLGIGSSLSGDLQALDGVEISIPNGQAAVVYSDGGGGYTLQTIGETFAGNGNGLTNIQGTLASPLSQNDADGVRRYLHISNIGVATWTTTP